MPHSTHFGPLDWVVLLTYLGGITAFGLWLSRRARTAGGYFLGDRRLPWWVMVGQAFGTGTHAEQPVAQVGATFDKGFATIWFQWKNMLITPLYWLMAPWYRRSERTTVAEMIEDRYGRMLAGVYTAFAIAFFVLNQGVMLKGAGKVIAVATGGELISPNGVVVAMTATFLLYSFFGGLVASAYTDFVQSLLILVLSFLLIPLGLHAVGGFAGLRQTLPSSFFDLYSEVSGIDLFTIAMLALNGFVGMTAQPHVLSMCATGNTERAGRIGHTYGAMTKRFCTIGWALTGLVVAALVTQRGVTLADPEHAFGYASRELLGPGLIGLLVACVLAANMSTCSNFMVNTGALFTRNVWLAYVRPAAEDRELLWMGRVSGLGLTGCGILFALLIDNVLQAFLFSETIAALFGVMFLGGILWRRANRQGAAAATLVAFASYYAALYLTTCAPGTAAKPLDLSSHGPDPAGVPLASRALRMLSSAQRGNAGHREPADPTRGPGTDRRVLRTNAKVERRRSAGGGPRQAARGGAGRGPASAGPGRLVHGGPVAGFLAPLSGGSPRLRDRLGSRRCDDPDRLAVDADRPLRAARREPLPPASPWNKGWASETSATAEPARAPAPDRGGSRA
ncbi:MAG: hypothetical protein HZC55_27820 [Verrucomicrobia bacterium]|nr:hypothetical protein [Verrucomicrobiota bacterium]